MKSILETPALLFCAIAWVCSCSEAVADAASSPAGDDPIARVTEQATDQDRPGAAAAAEKRCFEGISRSANICSAAELRSEQLVAASRTLTEQRRSLDARGLFELQRKALLESDTESFVSCLWVGNELDLVWAEAMVMGVAACRNLRTASVELEARYGPEGTASPCGEFLATMNGQLTERSRTVAKSRLVPVQGGFQIVDGDGNPNQYVAQRNGAWYVVNPTDRVDVVLELTRSWLQSLALSELVLEAVRAAEDLSDLTQRALAASGRATADFQAWQAAAIAQYGGSSNEGMNSCPRCGMGGFFGGRCQACRLDLTGARR